MKLTDKLCLPHVHEEGSRRHVISYGLLESPKYPFKAVAVDWCKEPFCKRNVHAVKACVEVGIEPADAAPLPALADWLKSPAGRAALQEVHE